MDEPLVLACLEPTTRRLSTLLGNYLKSPQTINAYLKSMGPKPITYYFSTNKEKLEDESIKMEYEKRRMEYQKLIMELK